VLALLAVLLLAGSALAAAKPGAPTAKTPKGTITTTKPSFAWGKATGAAKYELRVSQGKTQKLTKTGLTKLSWKAVKALPKNVSLTWKVRASNARGVGAWSKSLTFKIATLAIGDAYGGGIVAYVDGTGEHGLIAAAADQTPADSGIQWALGAHQSVSVPGALGTAIGTGAANTNAIIAQNGPGTTYAAGLARAYTGGGYSDWFLPSRDELNQLYVRRVAIGGFDTTTYPYYWSSSQIADDANYAWYQRFDGGGQDGYYKYDTDRVRAVRAF
jgi:hypothetical protein